MPSGPAPARAAGACAARKVASSHAPSVVRRAVTTVAEQDRLMRTLRYHGRSRGRQTLQCKVRLYDAERARRKAPRRAAAGARATGFGISDVAGEEDLLRGRHRPRPPYSHRAAPA